MSTSPCRGPVTLPSPFALQIWVHSAHNASGYFTIYGDESLQSDHFNSRLSFGDTQTVWARTGYLGFLRRTELTDANGGESSVGAETGLRPPGKPHLAHCWGHSRGGARLQHCTAPWPWGGRQ